SQQCCVGFINTLTLWRPEDTSCISIIQLEDALNPFDGMYMKFCKQVHYYSSICPKFIEALLILHDLPDIDEKEKIAYFDLFLNRQVGKDHPMLQKLMNLFNYSENNSFSLGSKN